ncbi:serine hydrolase [Fimbriiglobus ruber]|uniref:Beta-lactamase n=1 Tax=Fimbriiglobus ruber TaxID=1908690 RepID=A0A225DJZ1_9BACT|nr:serine hydrolase [Fimbriiglobus ruber]OWK41790.1 Beta-lactamase [Fimbriiglobus ruber]
MHSVVVVSVAFLALSARADTPPATGLEALIAPIAKEHHGKVAVGVKHLVTGESYYLNGDDVMPTASLIKLPVMVEAYWQAEEGKVKLDEQIVLKADDKVPGSGVLTDNFSPGSSLALRDAVRLMMTMSDNTATNLVLDKISIPATGVRMEAIGLKETKIHSKVFRGTTTIDKKRSGLYGLGSTTTKEMVQLLEKIHKGEVVTPKACEEMMAILGKNQDNEKLVRLLPPGTKVAHKTGSLNAAKTDAGIVYLRDPADKKVKPAFAICVLTNENQDQRWVVDNAAQLTIARIARAAYDHFAPK